VWRLTQTFFSALTRLSWNTTQQQLLSIPAVVVPPYATQSFGNERS